jgi:hypothetical protein
MVTFCQNGKVIPQKVYGAWALLILRFGNKSVSLWDNKGMGATARAKSPRLRGLFFTQVSLFLLTYSERYEKLTFMSSTFSSSNTTSNWY